MEDKIAQDLKTAMLAKDELRVSVLRSLKSAFTYAKVAPGAAVDSVGHLSEDLVLTILAREAKKRQEGADGFRQAGQSDQVDKELAEKAIIDAYLPAKLSKDEVRKLVEQAALQYSELSPKVMGQLITTVKQQAGPSADGAFIAQLVKERLSR